MLEEKAEGEARDLRNVDLALTLKRTALHPLPERPLWECEGGAL